MFCPEIQIHGGTSGKLCPSEAFPSHHCEVLSLKSATFGEGNLCLSLSWSRQVSCCMTASTERNLPSEIKYLQGNNNKKINNLLITIKNNACNLVGLY